MSARTAKCPPSNSLEHADRYDKSRETIARKIGGTLLTYDHVPSINVFRPLVLRALNDGEARQVQEIVDLVVDLAELSPEARAEQVPSGMKRCTHRIRWALSSFVQAGLLVRPKKAWYRITENGLTVDKRDLDSYSEKELQEWPTWVAYQEEVAARKKNSDASPTATTESEEDSEEPEEVMNLASRDFNSQVETILRRRLQDSSPEFFEKAVLELLWAMGYGGAHGSKEHLGQSGDGGIDGVIRQDALGLSKVYVQAKRYADGNTVGSGEIRNFIGALDSKGSNQGVFITSSKFAPNARTTANNYRHGTIVLIDGIELTRLMLAYGVAVQTHRTFTLYEIDEDFFEDSDS